MDMALRRPEDADQLAELIRRATNAKQRDRLRAIELAIAGHPTLTVIAMVGRSRGFVQRWCYAYRDHGLDAVKPKAQPGRPTKLPADQFPAFKQRVLDGPTDRDGACTLRGEDCRRILEQEFGASYGLSGVYELLHRLGLSVLVPRPRHRKSDLEAMRQWEERAPFLSARSSKSTPTNASRSGSRTRPASASKAR